MVRPFRDLPAPRHILDDNQFDDRDPLNEVPIVLPNVTIEHFGKNEECDYLFIVPSKLEAIATPLLTSNSELFAEIKISNSNNNGSSNKNETEQEYYDEGEQLYKVLEAGNSSNVLSKYEQDTINIYKLKLNKLIIHLVIIPIYKNKIIYNLLSRKLIATLLFKKIIVIGTSELNNGFETLNLIKSENFKIDSDDKTIGLIDQLPQLKPPHLVTGISGSILSMCAMFHLSSLGIIIDAEGAFNLDAEKCNNDSIIDCATVLNDYFKIGDDYVKQVEAAVFKTKGSSGLYI
ncbi:hypothetical protein B5S30_g3899 [[Candida] boidinii]|nr:hypothetical protein B5S30_g3899 [[Candida] boidinii]